MSKSFVSGKYIGDGPTIELYGLCNTNDDSVCQMPLPKENDRFVLLFPGNISNENYTKGLIECAVNLLEKINIPKGEDKCNKCNIPETLAIIVKYISGVLQWAINSDSWNTGELKEYDIMEIKRKLKIIC